MVFVFLVHPRFTSYFTYRLSANKGVQLLVKDEFCLLFC